MIQSIIETLAIAAEQDDPIKRDAILRDAVKNSLICVVLISRSGINNSNRETLIRINDILKQLAEHFNETIPEMASYSEVRNPAIN